MTPPHFSAAVYSCVAGWEVPGGGRFVVPADTGENVLQVSVRVEAATPATFDDGVNDGATFSGISVSHEQPVLLADGRGTNGIFDQVVVDLHPAVCQINRQGAPKAQRIINGSNPSCLNTTTASACVVSFVVVIAEMLRRL